METNPGKTPVQPRRRITARQVVVLVAAVVAVIFIVQNRGPVQIWLFTAAITAPLWLLLVVMVALGMAVGYLLARRR